MCKKFENLDQSKDLFDYNLQYILKQKTILSYSSDVARPQMSRPRQKPRLDGSPGITGRDQDL